MKNLIFLLFCLPFFATATTTLEEGLILQEELRFLEEVAKTEYKSGLPTETKDEPLSASNDLDLESTYFAQDNDEVRTRSSAPRRRSR